VRWPDEAIALLETGQVEELSRDHDLGDDERGTGYDVLVWIEEAVALRGFRPPVITVHSANAVGRQRMALAIEGTRVHSGPSRGERESLMIA
jgi:Cyclic-phosphate processing Receiver domain